MRWKSAIVVAAATLGACNHTPNDLPDRGVAAVNVPVLTRASYALDLAAPAGPLAPGEAAKLDNWFRTLNLGYGDAIYVDGPYSDAARADVAQVAGNYGMLVNSSAPVTAGEVVPGTVRVIVSRNRAEVPNCPNWSVPAQPNYNNRMLSNFGCAVNANLAAMIANPQDLVHGQDGSGVGDGRAGAKAINMYRDWPLTGIIDGQVKRPLNQSNTKEDK